MNKSNFKIQPYESTKLDANILSYLNVDSVGHVVTAEAWKALWGFVINGVNRTDAQLHYLLNAEDGIIHTIAQDHVNIKNEHAQISEEHNLLKLQFAKATANFEQFNKDAEEMRDIHEHVVNTSDALSKAFVHYGEEPPTNPNVRIWVCPTRGVLSPVIGKPTPQHGVVFNDYINNEAGLGTFASGINNKAPGSYCFATGCDNVLAPSVNTTAVFGIGNAILSGSDHAVFGNDNRIENTIKDEDGRIRTFGSHYISGSNNNVLGGGFGLVLGEANTHNSGWGNILAGQNNIIDYTDFTNSDYNIVSGQGNHLVKGYSNIISGVGNEATCNGSVVSGYNHTIQKFVGGLAVFGIGHYLPKTTDTAGNLLVAGRYSKLDSSRQLFVVGNGTSEDNRDNAFEVRSNVGGGGAYIILGGKSFSPSDIDNIKRISELETEINTLKQQLAELKAQA